MMFMTPQKLFLNSHPPISHFCQKRKFSLCYVGSQTVKNSCTILKWKILGCQKKLRCFWRNIFKSHFGYDIGYVYDTMVVKWWPNVKTGHSDDAIGWEVEGWKTSWIWVLNVFGKKESQSCLLTLSHFD